MFRSMLVPAALSIFCAVAPVHADDVKLLKKQPSTFPLVISVPASYRLKSNITVPDANTTAILVQVDYVTIHLNGFSIHGPVVCSGQLTTCSPSRSEIGIDATFHVGTTVPNGVIRGMGGKGLFRGGSGPRMRIESVSAVSDGDRLYARSRG
jgi:hypothetical protein